MSETKKRGVSCIFEKLNVGEDLSHLPDRVCLSRGANVNSILTDRLKYTVISLPNSTASSRLTNQ